MTLRQDYNCTTTPSIRTLSITTFSIMGLFPTLIINDIQHHSTLRHAAYRVLSVVIIEMLRWVSLSWTSLCGVSWHPHDSLTHKYKSKMVGRTSDKRTSLPRSGFNYFENLYSRSPLIKNFQSEPAEILETFWCPGYKKNFNLRLNKLARLYLTNTFTQV